MLYHELSNRLQAFRELPAVITAQEMLSYGDLLERSRTVAAHLQHLRGKRIGTYLPDGPNLVAALLALDALGLETCLIGGEWPVEKVRALADTFQIETIVSDREGDARFISMPVTESPATFAANTDPEASKVVIFTSGTTGQPKGAVHTWRSLSAGIKVDRKFQGTRWLLTYGFTRFAGLQVFLQAFLNGGCLVTPTSNDVEELAGLIEKHNIENVSGTPTFWRKFLTAIPSGKLSALQLKQITLGGEIVGQAILTALRSAFPAAQITHIYASTEAGVCFSVRDGKEGFPVDYLEESADRPALKIEDGELYIRSKRAMSGYVGQQDATDWFPSGDLVEIREDRVYFLGRKSDIINVGGSKVYPAEVEEEIKKVPGVLNVRVSGQRSSFAGQLVRAEVVAGNGVSIQELKTSIMKWCAETLASYKRPRLIDFVPALEENESRKIVRHKSNEQ